MAGRAEQPFPRLTKFCIRTYPVFAHALLPNLPLLRQLHLHLLWGGSALLSVVAGLDKIEDLLLRCQ